MTTEKKPKCRLSGTDSNVFALGGLVGRTLKRAGQEDKAKEFRGKLSRCHSYDEALQLMMQYIEVS